jgi:YHS domain-containing protein
MKQIFSLFTVVFIFIACNSNEKVKPNVEMKKDTVTTTKTTDFKSITIDYKKDPVCGMPITAGIEDTLLYKGKIIAFCSKECKTSFIDKPSLFTLTSK